MLLLGYQRRVGIAPRMVDFFIYVRASRAFFFSLAVIVSSLRVLVGHRLVSTLFFFENSQLFYLNNNVLIINTVGWLLEIASFYTCLKKKIQ
jgi:hypothetical protein